MKIVKFLEGSGLLPKDAGETIENEAIKLKKKVAIKAGDRVIQGNERTIRAAYSLSYFEIQISYQNEPKLIILFIQEAIYLL